MPDTLPDATKAALDRLIGIAQRDTGQSRKVANFLLAWWNANEGFIAKFIFERSSPSPDVAKPL